MTNYETNIENIELFLQRETIANLSFGGSGGMGKEVKNVSAESDGQCGQATNGTNNACCCV